MAQTQLNRVYVQSIDGTGVTTNALSIGTKALTGSITIGGTGTANNKIVVDGTGVRINTTTLDGTTSITNLNATTAIVSGTTSLQNTSTLHLGVRGNASITNASINALQVIGQTNLNNASITNLGVTSQITLQNTSINGTLDVAGLTTLVNVSTTSLSVLNNVSIGGNVSIKGDLRCFNIDAGNTSVNGTLNVAGQTVLKNTSVNDTLKVDGRTTLRILDVNGQASLYAGLTVTGETSVIGSFTSSSLTSTAGSTTLGATTATTLTATGLATLSGGVTATGTININTTGGSNTGIGTTNSGTVFIRGSTVSLCDTTGNANICGSGLAQNGYCSIAGGTNTTGSYVVLGSDTLDNSYIRAKNVEINTNGSGNTNIGSTGLATLIKGSAQIMQGLTLGSTGDNASHLNFGRNGNFTMGVGPEANPTLIMGNPSNQVNILGKLLVGGNTELKNTTATILTATGLASLNGGLTSTAGNTTLGATTATTLTTNGLATMSSGLTSTAGNTTLGETTATTFTATGLATLSNGVTATGTINVNATGSNLTTIGTNSRTVIGNMSTSDTTVTGSLWVTGATAINKTGTAITEIGNTQAGSRTVIGNTSMNGGIDINTTGTGITTMGSATSSTVVNGDMSVTKLLTTGYAPSLYNYAPTFFATGFSGGNVSFSNGPEYGFTLTASGAANVSSISPVSFMANKKYIVNFNARSDLGSPTVSILGTTFNLTATNTLYRQVITSTVNTSTLALVISGAPTNKVSWSLLTIEPFYDMTLGSNQISLGGEINVSAGNPYTDWDPTRMLFTTSTISIGANPRIAIGKNTATNTSTYVATCDGAVNASFMHSIDGVTWDQGNFTAVTNPRGIAYNEINSTFYMITGESPAKVWTSTAGSSGWSTFSTTGAINSVTNMIYGNGNLVAFNSGTSGNIMNIGTGTTWSVTTNEVPKTITDMAYGKIGGAHLFVACATDSFYRNTNTNPNGYAAVDWGPATTSQPGAWAFIGFGNNKFIAASNDATGKVSHSINGLVWQTPILLNEILTSEPIFLESTWFIGSNTGLYVSKDDGLTWTKRVGNSLTRSVYGGRFVDIGTRLSLITKRNQRTDGSSISPDVITIGQEGATTVIGDSLIVRNNGLSNISLAGIVNASSGPVTTEAPFTFTNSYTVNDEAPRIVYGNGIFVLAGAGKVHYSSDGSTWALSTTATPAITGDLRGLAFGNGIFMVIAQGATSVNSKVWTSTNGNNWTPGTDAIPGIYGLTFGNGVFVGVSSMNLETSIATTPGTGTIAWTTRTVTGTTGLQACAFGAMSNGTNVFVVAGLATVIPKRSIDNGVTWQNAAAIPAQSSAIDFIGFGNDIFMATTNDGQDKLSISRDGGLTWSPSVQFGMALRSVIYVEKKWYIGTGSNIILTSNDDGVTWRKVEGPNFLRAAYGNSLFVTAGSSIQSVISFKKNRSDGSAITTDVLTIGREGTKATIASDTLAISGKIYVPPATLTSEGGLTFSTDQTTLGGTPEYSNKGQRSNQVRIQTFSLTIMDEPSYYSGKNMVSIITMASGSKSLNSASGEYTYVTNATNSTYGSTGFLNLFTTTAGQTLLTAGQTYKIVFTVKAITTNTTINICDLNNLVILDLGYIGLSYKTYVGYFTATTSSIYFGVFSTASFEKTIVMKHLSVDKVDSPNVLDVTGRVGLSEPITIGYTIPILNNQLGYYVKSITSASGVDLRSSLSFSPIGPLLPGIYQANIFITVTPNYQYPLFHFKVLGRTTPFTSNTVVTGGNIVYDKDGLTFYGYKQPGFTVNDNIDFNISGFINLKPTDTLDGTTVSYFCVQLYCQVQPVNVGGVYFSVVRIG